MPRSNNTPRAAGGGVGGRVQRRLRLADLRKWLWILFRTALIVGLAFMILFPLSTKISRSFMTWEDVNDPTVYYIPRDFTLDNFRTAWAGLQYPITLLKSIGIAAIVTLLQTTSCTLVAYGLARFEFIGKKVLFAAIILTLLIPPQTILTPLYLRFRYFNPAQFVITDGIMSGVSLINTLVPFILLSATALAFKSGLYVYMLRQYFVNMPKALAESACIDGCGHFRTFYRIMLPNAVPIVVTAMLFSFVWQWNDYNYSVMLAPNLPTLPMKMIEFQSYLGTTQGMAQTSVLADSPMFLLLIAPLLILYVFTQRFFVESVARSGIVG